MKKEKNKQNCDCGCGKVNEVESGVNEEIEVNLEEDSEYYDEENENDK